MSHRAGDGGTCKRNYVHARDGMKRKYEPGFNVIPTEKTKKLSKATNPTLTCHSNLILSPKS